MKKLVLRENGNEQVLVQGSEEEILKYWKNEKYNLTDWIFENLENEEEIEELKKAIEEEVTNLRELEYNLNIIDHDYWTLEII